MEHRKPQAIPRKLDEAKQKAFIEKYNALLNALPEDEAVIFADAVHPTHHGAARRLLGATRRAGCGRTKQRPRPAEHPGAIDLETGKTKMIEALTVDAQSAIMLFIAIMAMYPDQKANSRLSGQRQIPPCGTGSRMASPARLPH